jgi:hypothetical protein
MLLEELQQKAGLLPEKHQAPMHLVVDFYAG